MTKIDFQNIPSHFCSIDPQTQNPQPHRNPSIKPHPKKPKNIFTSHPNLSQTDRFIFIPFHLTPTQIKSTSANSPMHSHILRFLCNHTYLADPSANLTSTPNSAITASYTSTLAKCSHSQPINSTSVI